MNNNLFINPFSSDAYRTPQYIIIMQVITTYIHYSAMNLQLSMEIGFLYRRISSLTLSVLS